MIVYRELSSLERDLGIPAKTLYAVSNHISRHYRTVEIPKKDGGVRTLSVPDEILGHIQRRIAHVLLAHMPVSQAACAYRFGGSTLRNARPHVGKPLVLKLDILRFFDSIRYSDVKDTAFPGEIYSEPIRILLAMLCYYRDALPQGAPSSPAITNLLLYEFDEKVLSWCRLRGIAYTRYCDDMTFSGNFDAGEVIRFIEKELKHRGFLLNGKKTRLQTPGTRQCVTGIVVNEKPNAPAQYRRALRQELYYCRKFGIEEHLGRLGLTVSAREYAAVLLGRVQYLLQFSPGDPSLEQAKRWLRTIGS